MRISLVLGVVGQLVRRFSLAFLPPMALASLDHDYGLATTFLAACLCTYVLASLAALRFRHAPVFQRAEALAVVSLTWASVALFGAIPYVFCGLSFTDAYFESMSGFTTTGATIFEDFSRYGRAIFLWRAMTQWFGGLGVIALFLVVLPRLGIAGRQLFFAEASGAPGEAISPQVREGASRLWVLYIALTTVLTLLLWVAGMSGFDALLHAFTTMAAGGFSPHPASIAGYQNPAVEWILVVFMILAGTSFALQYKVFTGRVLGFFADGEFLFYFGATLIAAIGVSFVLAEGVPNLDHLRMAAFQAASLVSSTGFASTDYNLWPDAARALLIFVMLVSGCAGSAAGGPKSIRLLLVIKRIMLETTRVLHPRAVLPLRYKKKTIPDDIVRAVYTLVTLYMGGYFLFGFATVLLGTDLITGFSAALACLGNIGPGFGPVGPMGNFAGLSTATKWLLSIAMWVGRLEIVTVLALLHPHVLRQLRWDDPHPRPHPHTS